MKVYTDNDGIEVIVISDELKESLPDLNWESLMRGFSWINDDGFRVMANKDFERIKIEHEKLCKDCVARQHLIDKDLDEINMNNNLTDEDVNELQVEISELERELNECTCNTSGWLDPDHPFDDLVDSE